MPEFKVSVPHKLGRQQAKERLKTFAAELKEKYASQVKDMHEEWKEDSVEFGFTTFGMQIKATVAAGDDSVDIDGEIPMAAVLFKGRIEQEVRQAVEKALS